MDWSWIVFLGAVAGLVGLRAALRVDGPHFRALWAGVWLPATTIFVYLSALSLKDRYAAVAAAAITCSSATLATVFAFSPATGAATALLSAFWLFFDRDWLALAGISAAIATLCRPEMFFLGLVLIGYGIFQKKSQAGIGTASFFAILIAFGTITLWFHLHVPLPADFTAHGPYTVLWACGPIFLWFFLPFIAELTDSAARNRWLPIVTWLLIFILAVCIMDRSSSLTFTAPAFAACYIIGSAGIARILPSVAGDMPTPVYRYVVAALAVIGLVALRFTNDANAARELLRNLSHPDAVLSRPIGAAHKNETNTRKAGAASADAPHFNSSSAKASAANHFTNNSAHASPQHESGPAKSPKPAPKTAGGATH